MPDTKNLRQLCLMLYGLYIASLLSFCTDSAIAGLGAIAGTVGVILAYAKRGSAKNTPFESHFHYLIRTFWIGGGVWFPVATVLASGLIFILSDLAPIYDAMSQGEMDIFAIAGLVEQYLADNKTFLISILAATFTPVALWWLWRCSRGYLLARGSKPIAKPDSWL